MDVSLFSHLQTIENTVALSLQYRMNEDIQKVANFMTYGGQLGNYWLYAKYVAIYFDYYYTNYFGNFCIVHTHKVKLAGCPLVTPRD